MGNKKRSLLLIAVVCWALFQAGCSGVAQSNIANPVPPPPGAQPSPGSGSPSSGSPSPDPVPSSPGAQPQVEYLYLPSYAECAVPSYSIDPNTGLLTILPGAPFATGGNSPAQTLTSDPARRFYFSGSVPVYAHGGKAGDASISVLKREPTTGALISQQTIPITPDPLSLAVDVSGRFLYTNGFAEAGNVFRIDPSSGTLTPLPGSPFPALTGVGLVAHPTKPFLYSVSFVGREIYGYRLDQSTGEPIPLPGSPFSTAAELPHLAIDPAGQLLYVGDENPGPNLYVFRIQNDGSISLISGSPFASGGAVNSVIAGGDFLYVSTWDYENNIYGFRVDRSTGRLTEVAHIGVPNSMPDLVAIDDSGRFLYAKEATDIYLFTIDQSTGSLTFKGPAKKSAP